MVVVVVETVSVLLGCSRKSKRATYPIVLATQRSWDTNLQYYVPLVTNISGTREGVHSRPTKLPPIKAKRAEIRGRKAAYV
jgi:hypothetical protein